MSLLALLDLSVAFDAADHTILLDRLQSAFGVRGRVFHWIESFITNRSPVVSFAGSESTVSLVLCGVPQPRVLGPILFLLYCADVTNIAERHGVTAHSYADDTQQHVHAKTQHCATEATRLTSCIAELDLWMTSNRLRLNSDDKTQLIWVGSRQQLANECHSGRDPVEGI